MSLFSHKFSISRPEPLAIAKVKLEEGSQELEIRKRDEDVFWIRSVKPVFTTRGFGERKSSSHACSALVKLVEGEKNLISVEISLTSLRLLGNSLVWIFCIGKLVVDLSRGNISQNSLWFLAIPIVVTFLTWLSFQNEKNELETKIRRLIASQNPNGNYM